MNRLICDEPTCDHTEPMDRMTEGLIGKPCPKCGASLLTREDYEEGLKYQAIIDVLKDMGLAGDEPGEGDAGDKVMLSINPHDGELTMKMRGLK